MDGEKKEDGSGRKGAKAGRKWEETAGKDVCENGKGRVRTGRKRG